MNNQDLPELTPKEMEEAILEGRVKKKHHLRAIKNGVQFDENGAITSFSPETDEMLNRVKDNA